MSSNGGFSGQQIDHGFVKIFQLRIALDERHGGHGAHMLEIGFGINVAIDFVVAILVQQVKHLKIIVSPLAFDIGVRQILD